MSPTRRDTLKAAGAASGLAMLGGHVIAQQGGPGSDDDGPGAQQLEEGEAGVRFGHFVAGAPAVDVRLVPADGADGTDTDDGDTPPGTDNETGGNASDDDTSEDLQLGNDSNDTDDADNETDGGVDVGNDTNETDGGLGGDNDTADNETDGGVGTPDDTDDGEGELIAENLSFGDVSEYANVEAGDYTLRVVEAEGEPTDANGGTDGNATDTDGTANDTDNESDDEIISLPPDLTGEDNGSDDGNDTSGNDTDEDLQLGNDTDDTDNESDDGLFGNDTNDTDDGVGTPDGTTGDGEVVHEAEVTVGETYSTVAAVGTGADDVRALVLQDYDAAQVRLVHASPDAPVVDVVAPDATMTLFDGVGSGQATEYVGVPPGSYSLSVREAADMNDGDEVATSDVELDSGEAYSVYAVGSPEGGEEEFQLVVEQDGQGADAGFGQEGAPGQQPGGPGGNETDDDETDGPGGQGPGGEGPPGQDDDTGGPGGAGRRDADDANGTDEPGGPGGAAGPNTPGNDSGNDSEEDDDFL